METVQGPRYKAWGYTVIELLVMVAILGVLAAVVTPNVGQWLGAGKRESKQTELQIIQASVSAMMADNDLITLPNPVAVATNDMSAFPDAVTSASAKGLVNGVDNPGYVLYDHDKGPGELGINYVVFDTATCNYLVSAIGTVTYQDGTTNPDTGCP